MQDRVGQVAESYWSLPPGRLMAQLRATDRGLTTAEAAVRLAGYGPNAIEAATRASALGLYARQFKSPLVLILIVASVISLVATEWLDAGVVLAIVLGSTILGFVQEYVASNAVERLRSQVTLRALVMRDGVELTLPSAEVVPGDVVRLRAGSLVPADALVLDANDFFVSQAVLTGETFPVEKMPGSVAPAAGLNERSNCVFMGTSVRSGTARVLVAATGRRSVFGQVAGKLALRPALTEFERGIQRFGYLLTRIMLVMVMVVLAINIFMDKPPVESLLFALALAVGLAPELLPAIISVTLSHGAKRMARLGVIVRRLNSIENLGSMDVLCTDKTGTLTAGVVQLDAAVDLAARPSAAVLRLACINARFQTGMANPLDEAVSSAGDKAGVDLATVSKVDEIPYDFVRRSLSVVAADPTGVRTLVTKGALSNVLAMCDRVRDGTAAAALDAAARAQIEASYDGWSTQGFRVLGVASRTVDRRSASYSRGDETGMCFEGFLLFLDPPKDDARQTLVDLAQRGVQLKMITGDNHKVARHIAQAIGLPVEATLTGAALDTMSDEALLHAAQQTTVFAEVDPNQKERIILALRKTGHVVGYMGDGINDAPALHSADVGISVDTAVDVAKDAADFMLLRKDLAILRAGIDEGRMIFANTLKYILTTISANFGNMFSMAVASVLLPFLPLLASQILLNNFLSDIPAAAIASDTVDDEWVAKPRRWDTAFIRDYMVLFGLVSSVFDFLTFGALLWLFQATPEEFRTGWFIESLLTELVIALVVRTRGPFWRSRPGHLLLASTAAVTALALALPYLPFVSVLGFVPLPASLVLAMIVLTLAYVAAAEVAKRFFYRRR
ncbi:MULTISPECIES: magnesium-translocating P-type ATPase [unclassified Variovorax]|uniref:magnesium-translocating P-type ATPase n=1 Tax=unclassified Variovorax TaxID=663243 RepID=UPI00076C5C0B|nr:MULTISPECIES: magnesium-translocating P-type ATPase [unclassified Variovorax]KWT73307.1 Mg2+ transport ATPase [Variovorax sp. WDL1]PNG47160.1 Magnesium-transporting ATPase, P-type 1 [Variovorax sp. B2]PNG48189.1 Magnesium-transporting ATPase, P-type 1 [Variovorax sp. B4]VTV15035.1 Magnesium-transporting ATPase, P-type 1 [Variovorax sp. WDL1]